MRQQHLTTVAAWTFVLIFSAPGSLLSQTRFEIAGRDHVTDGWIRTNNTTSFTDQQLAAHGRAWSAYDSVLIRFKLDSIDAAQFGRVKKATLRLHAVEVNNPKQRPTAVAPCAVPWTAKATSSSPTGEKTTWPVRASHPNINYAMIDDLAARCVITKPGAVEFDVTEIVERWLYQGLPNHGLMVTASPPIFGKPNAGSWTLSFAASESKQSEMRPALIVEMEGAPPSPEKANERALALYPSASLAPVRDPYFFAFYNAGDRKQWRRLPTINVTTYSSHGGWLEPRGVMNLGWAEGGPASWLPTAESFSTYYTNIAKNNTIGFCGHESNLGERMPWLADAFRAAEATHPRIFSAYYYRGETLMAKTAGEGRIDLLIQEGYTHVHKQFPMKGFAIGMEGIKARIDTARKHGAIERHIVMLGHICNADAYHRGHELTPEKVDGMITELRRYAPEMPGIGFYGAGGDELAVECDRLARKHFVDPAPEILITKPRFEATLRAPHVSIEVEAEPKSDRQVVRYRWFIDNRLVAEMNGPRYLWDTRGERTGHHVITVHAVDDAWNRAAAQIPVQLERTSPKVRSDGLN
jgi:hypothetical protein